MCIRDRVTSAGSQPFEGEAPLGQDPREVVGRAVAAEAARPRGRRLRLRLEADPEPVSYTHLRTHETVLDLVCRLLLETNNNNRLSAINPVRDV